MTPKRDRREEETPAGSPLHGYQGDRGAVRTVPGVPAGLTIALSREAGARGGTIGRRVGRKLGWQVYGQELLEYTAQEGNFRPSVYDHLSEAQTRWVGERLDALIREQELTQHPSVVSLARLILALGSQGELLLIGRGAGCILPRATTLNVRIIADLKDRIAYLGQYLRLTQEEAAEQVRLRDQNRADFVSTHFHRQPGDVYQYDLVLNSGLLGEDLCVELIAHAARAKAAAVWGDGGEE